MVKLQRHIVNGKVPQDTPFHFLWESSKILVLEESFIEPSTKSLQDAVIQACAGVEVIPQGASEGDHMANGRVDMAVREVKRQCRTLRISAEQNINVRIAGDSPLLSWLPRFCSPCHEQHENRCRWKTSELRRTGRRWTKPMA